MIQKHLTTHSTNKYIDVLQKLIDTYNSKYHTTIKMSPIDASKIENREAVLSCFRDKPFRDKPKFSVGDRVRIYRYKGTFEKGYKPNWTREVFIVDKVKWTNPITYVLKDENNEPILGSFYKEELQKISF